MHFFYSWQSSLPAKYNRYFIQDCLKRAIKQLNQDLEIEEAIRIDHDTKDVPGSPDIANTIFSKIKECDLFIGDISFVASGEGERLCPNPNVMIELGYAICSLKDSRVLNIMNTAYGEPEKLPFDLAHKRWPIRYRLDESNDSQKAQIRKELVRDIYAAVSAFINSQENTNVIQQEPSISLIDGNVSFASGLNGYTFQTCRIESTIVISNRSEQHAILKDISFSTTAEKNGKIKFSTSNNFRQDEKQDIRPPFKIDAKQSSLITFQTEFEVFLKDKKECAEFLRDNPTFNCYLNYNLLYEGILGSHQQEVELGMSSLVDYMKHNWERFSIADALKILNSSEVSR